MDDFSKSEIPLGFQDLDGLIFFKNPSYTTRSTLNPLPLWLDLAMDAVERCIEVKVLASTGLCAVG